ncbi:MAG: MBL fold metallo-hydrolase [Firmicutes bacterium]|nr:MBL fold metallo-hydrolase [Bacillota bacterium]
MSKNLVIHYLGISAFVFVLPNGDKIGIDFWTPGAFSYSDDTPTNNGIPDGRILKCHLVSHDHKDHCFVPDHAFAIQGVVDGKIEDGKTVLKLPDLSVRQYDSEHFNPSMGRGSKANTVFVFDFDGLVICHLADAFGTLLDSQKLLELKKKIGKIDLLLLPIDGANIKPLSLPALFSALQVLAPSAVIPMHYYATIDKTNFMAEAKKRGFKIADRVSEFTLNKDLLRPSEGMVFYRLSPAPFRII